MPSVALNMRLVPVRTYPTVKSWDLLPTINGTSSLNNDIGQGVSMPATCNRIRVYLAGLMLTNSSSGTLVNRVGSPNLVLKGFDNLDQKMCEIPVGVHLLQACNGSNTSKLVALPAGFTESRQINQYTQSSAPAAYTQKSLKYGWTARGGETIIMDTNNSASGGNAGVSNARDNLVLAGTMDVSSPNNDGFAVTVAPWTIEAPIARWLLDGIWQDTGGQSLGFSTTMAFSIVVFGLFVGEQV